MRLVYNVVSTELTNVNASVSCMCSWPGVAKALEEYGPQGTASSKDDDDDEDDDNFDLFGSEDEEVS